MSRIFIVIHNNSSRHNKLNTPHKQSKTTILLANRKRRCSILVNISTKRDKYSYTLHLIGEYMAIIAASATAVYG